MNNYQITVKTLELIKNIIPVHPEDDHSRMAEDDRDSIRAIEKVIQVVKSEAEYQADQEAHSDATLEMEMGKAIPLGEWARKHGLDESYARQKARRGSFKSAHKVGRDWFINELEQNIDNRRKRK